MATTRFYLFTNPSNTPKKASVEFTERAIPEVWDPWTGKVRTAVFTSTSGHSSADVILPPFGSELLAFDNANHQHAKPQATAWTETKRQDVGDGGWTVDAVGNSDQGVGIREHLEMAKLIDWTTDQKLRTFSGSATYITHITVSPDDLGKAKRILLDLGEVKDAAKVKINGVTAGKLIVHPFSVDIRGMLHSGQNEIEVTVINSLTNYLSTVQLPKIPGAQIRHYDPTSAGLIGPAILTFQSSGLDK